MAIVNDLIMQVDGNNIVVYPNTVGRAVYINESNGYNLIQALEDLRNNSIASWNSVTNKPFSSIGDQFRVIDGQLQLNSGVPTEWNDIQNKPNVFNSSWSRISGKPDYFPTSWNDIANKPNNYGSDWNNIDNKPNYFPTDWDLVENRPIYFSTEWNLVENRPTDFASSWEDVNNKPFTYLDNYFFNVSNDCLSLVNILNLIDMNTYNNLVDSDQNYYLVYGYEANGSNAGGVGVILPQLNGLQFVAFSNGTYNAKPAQAGVKIPVEGEAYYYPLNNGVWFNFVQNFTQYYFNENIDKITNGYSYNGNQNEIGLKTDYVTSAIEAFANYNSDTYFFSNDLVIKDIQNANLYKMFFNVKVNRDQSVTFKNYPHNNNFYNIFDSYSSNANLIIGMDDINGQNIYTPYLQDAIVNTLIFNFNNYISSNAVIIKPQIYGNSKVDKILINGIQYLYANQMFKDVEYLNSGVIFNSTIEAKETYANCINLTQAVIENDASNARNIYGCFQNCYNLNNVIGGGNATHQLNGLVDASCLFYNSTFSNDIEFNFYASQFVNVMNMFSENAININKKIHILKDSVLDSKINAGNMRIMPDISGYDSNNVTILSNGILFNDYNLYIYNDLSSNIVVFNELPEVDRLVSNVIFTGSEYFDTTDTNLINLGAWDQTNNTSRTKAYLNTLSNEVYLTTNNIPISNVFMSASMIDTYPYIQGLDLYSTENIQSFDFVEQITNYIGGVDPYDVNGFWIRFQGCDSMITTPNYGLFNLPDVLQINLASAFYYCNNLISVSYLDNRINNLWHGFDECKNLQYINQNIIHLADNCNLTNCFNNCTNLIDGLQFISNNYCAANMYTNCKNLSQEQIISKGFSNLKNMYRNCGNVSRVEMHIDINSNRTLFNDYPWTWCEGLFQNCYNLSDFKFVLENNIENLGAGNYLNYGYYNMFANCKSLIYMPIISSDGNIYLDGYMPGAYYNSDNMVVAQFPNLPTSNKQMVNVNSYSNFANNMAVASIGNGYISSSTYMDLDNLIIGAAAEDFAGLSLNGSSYSLFENCRSMLYGRMTCMNEFQLSGRFYSYNNCYNLLVTEVSDDMRYAWRNVTSVFSQTYLNYSYGNCYNLVYAYIPPSFTLQQCFHNCYNLKVVEIDINHQSQSSYNFVNTSFHNCYNLTTIYVSKGLSSINNSFLNARNLTNIDSLNILGSKYQSTFGSYSGGCIWWSFNNCGITSINWDNARMYNIFNSFCECNNLINVNISNSSISEGIKGSFNIAPNLRSINLTNCLVGSLLLCPSTYDNGYENLTDLVFDVVSNRGPSWLSGSFYNCPNLTNVTVSVPACVNNQLYGSYDSTNNMYGIMFDTTAGASWGILSNYNIKSYKVFANNNQHFIQISNFSNLVSLTDVEFNGDGEIRQYYGGGHLFYNCHSLQNITGTIHQLSGGGFTNSFEGCYMLQEPFDNIVHYDGGAYSTYRNCWSLRNCSHLNFTALSNTYSDCYNLTESYCPPTATYMDYTFINCTNIATVDIGPNVTNFAGAYQNCFNIPNNIRINSIINTAMWAAAFEYRAETSLDIHIYENSGLYNQLTLVNMDYNNILLNAPELGTGYSNICIWDADNRRFYWDQPNIGLNIYYDLED